MTTSTQQSLPRPDDTFPEGSAPRIRALARASALALGGFAAAVARSGPALPRIQPQIRSDQRSRGKGRRGP